VGYWGTARSLAEEVAELEERLGNADDMVVELEAKVRELDVVLDRVYEQEEQMEHAMISAAPFLPSRAETRPLLDLVKGLVAQALEEMQIP